MRPHGLILLFITGLSLFSRPTPGTDLKMTQKTCWVVTDGKPGMENQALGLAEAVGFDIEVKRIAIKAPWRWLPPMLWFDRFAALHHSGDDLVPPWPDLLIGCGRMSVPYSLAVRRKSLRQTFTVQLQNPAISTQRFDLVAPPHHDHLTGENVVQTRGAVHRVTPERLAAEADKFRDQLAHLPRPLVAVLIGGNNKCYSITPEITRTLADRLLHLTTEYGAGLAVTPSRRTGAANEQVLRETLADAPAVVWDGTGDNPYFGYLGLADAVIVTCDSVSMVSEAASTGKPVYVVELQGGNRKFGDFHAMMQSEGITRPFSGGLEHWEYPEMNDTGVVAEEILRRINLRG
jgi:hypothetical protein